MASTAVIELKKKSDAAAANLSKQLQGMEPLLDKSDAAGEWTTGRRVRVVCRGRWLGLRRSRDRLTETQTHDQDRAPKHRRLHLPPSLSGNRARLCARYF